MQIVNGKFRRMSPVFDMSPNALYPNVVVSEIHKRIEMRSELS